MNNTEPSSVPSKPKIGCVSWCFHLFDSGSDPQPAIDVIGELGFDGLDLILLSRHDIEGYWTSARIDAIRRQLDRYRLEVAQFVLYQPVVEGLPSLDPSERERNLDYFESGCRIGRQLGAPLINIVAPWPRELKAPVAYLPRYYDLSEPKPGEKFRIEVAPSFDWDSVWESFIATTKACLQRAKAHGMKFTIENHTHTMTPDTASFLRLWDAIGDTALGYNLDAGWIQLEREYPPVAVHKAGRHLMNVHMRDIDGLMRTFVHVGEGVMDFQAMAATLNASGFTGYVSLEQDKHPGDMRATCERYVHLMREYLG